MPTYGALLCLVLKWGACPGQVVVIDPLEELSNKRGAIGWSVCRKKAAQGEFGGIWLEWDGC